MTKPCCSHSGDEINRRRFLAATAAGATGVAAASLLPAAAHAAPTRTSAAETAIRELYAILSDEQKKEMALPLSDPRRKRISANWSITKAAIGKFFSKSQQELIHRIVKGATSADGFERFKKQTEQDWGGMDRYAVALFGNPNKGEFEFEMTGRHLTLRADGNSVPGRAFGGPIVYGHSRKGNSEKNLFSYQTKQANKVFQALDSGQREKALLAKPPRENQVQLRKDTAAIPGISGGDLSEDQQQLVLAALADIMKPYRKEDVDEVMKIVKAAGGAAKLNMAFYQAGDLDKDEQWDVWRIEGPTLVCHFRGAPHVHAYINVAERSTLK